MSSADSGAVSFPLPLIRYPVTPRSHRTRTTARRASTARYATKVANYSVQSLNHLSTSYATSYQSPSPCVSVSLNSAAANEASAAQMRLLRRVYDRARKFVSHQPHRGSRDRSNVYLNCPPSAAHDFSYQRSTATPIVADRVSLPAVAGTVDLLSVLPPDMAARYASDFSIIPTEAKNIRRPCFHGSADEYVRLIRRLRAAGMVDFTTSPRTVNGLFGVPKDGGQIRLIIDARPANVRFPVPETVKLPTPDVMANVRARNGRRFYVAKSDVSDFYHRLRLPLWMAPFFALPSLRAADVGSDVAFRR